MGILAGVFGDGWVRVLDVKGEWIGNVKKGVNVRIEKAMWEQSFGEDALATCVAWKSHHEIIVGYSNGITRLVYKSHIRLCSYFRSRRQRG